MSVATVVTQVNTSCPLNMVAEQGRTAEEPASEENAVGSRRAAWRIIARTERTVTSETDVSSSGIYKIKGVGDVFARRVEHAL